MLSFVDTVRQPNKKDFKSKDAVTKKLAKLLVVLIVSFGSSGTRDKNSVCLCACIYVGGMDTTRIQM